MLYRHNYQTLSKFYNLEKNYNNYLYQLHRFHLYNCKNQYEITLINPTELIIDNVATASPTCFNYSNGSAAISVIGGTQPYTYQLQDVNSNIINTLSNTINLSSGLYLYVVIDDNGCTEDISFEILNPDEISIVSNYINNVDCFGENTGSLNVDVNNAVNGSYQIVWTPNEFNTNSETIVNLSAGQYEAVVVDENGCTKLDSFIITQNERLDSDISTINASCKLNPDGQIDLIILGGVSPYNLYNDSILLDSDIISSYSMTSLLSDVYNIKITDSYNCQFDTLISVSFNGGYDCINEPIIITPNFDNYNDQWTPILDLDVEIEVSILNRWGQKEYKYIGNSLFFSWNGLANWGGERDLPSADYYYIIKFNNSDFPDRTGVITLIR